jgi:hypothetical protein
MPIKEAVVSAQHKVPQLRKKIKVNLLRKRAGYKIIENGA